MRHFKEYITERLVLNKHAESSSFFPEKELNRYETLMHFKNGAALFMFDAEMKGQISDGKYENSGPRGHYFWVSKTVYCIDGNEYHTNNGHEKRYNLNEWVRNIKSMLEIGEPKDKDYDFAIRMYDYGKFAHVLGDNMIYKLYQDKKLNALRAVIEIMGDTYRANRGYKDFVKDCKETTWVVNYYYEVENIVTEDVFNKFVEFDYTFKEFREDEKSMEATVNTIRQNNMKTLKDILFERLVISKNTHRYTIDDITAKELCELVEKYREYHGVLPASTNSSKMDLHDIYGDDNKTLPYNKERGSTNMQIVYLSEITHKRKSGDDKYGLYLTGTRNEAMFRYGMSELLDILGEDCLIEIYSFLKRKVEELDKQE